MRIPRNLRKWLVVTALGAMLLAQQAVAAYACPLDLQGRAQVVATMENCEDDGSQVSALCVKHCQMGSDSVSPPDFSWATTAAPVLHHFVVTLVASPPSLHVESYLAHSSSPPLVIRLQRFLI